MKMMRIFAAVALAISAAPAMVQAQGNQGAGTINKPASNVAVQIGGQDGGFNLRAVGVDNRGGIIPAQGVVTTARTTLTASTATALEPAAVAGRIGLTVQLETALTANLFLCTTQATSCSATSYDAIIPNAAGAGTTYTFLFAPSTRVYAFSTGTPIVVLNSWVAP